MQSLDRFFFLSCLIIIRFIFISKANPLMGYNIRLANSNEFEFIVSIGNKRAKAKNGEDRGHFCGGALITRRHVLTAEHCIIPDIYNIEITVGSGDLKGGHKYNVESTLTYNEWADNKCIKLYSRDNDIAVMKLTRCVSSSINLATITSATSNTNFFGQDAITAGWGKTDTEDISRYLKTTTLRIITQADCISSVNDAFNNTSKLYVWKRLICTKTDLHTLVGCGDSGGPLFINGNEIIGINESVCPSQEKVPTIQPDQAVNMHVGVAHFQPFIKTFTELNQDFYTCTIL